LGSPSQRAQSDPSIQTKIASALSAGPEQITKDATIAEVDAAGTMRMLRAGSNGWICMPAIRILSQVLRSASTSQPKSGLDTLKRDLVASVRMPEKLADGFADGCVPASRNWSHISARRCHPGLRARLGGDRRCSRRFIAVRKGAEVLDWLPPAVSRELSARLHD
jgi:hypothetical protein